MVLMAFVVLAAASATFFLRFRVRCFETVEFSMLTISSIELHKGSESYRTPQLLNAPAPFKIYQKPMKKAEEVLHEIMKPFLNFTSPFSPSP